MQLEYSCTNFPDNLIPRKFISSFQIDVPPSLVAVMGATKTQMTVITANVPKDLADSYALVYNHQVNEYKRI